VGERRTREATSRALDHSRPPNSGRGVGTSRQAVRARLELYGCVAVSTVFAVFVARGTVCIFAPVRWQSPVSRAASYLSWASSPTALSASQDAEGTGRNRTCLVCGHVRSSHYVSIGTERLRLPLARTSSTAPMPCHVVKCICHAYMGFLPQIPCPACTTPYATRKSLEIHLAKAHTALTRRQRSSLLSQALKGWV
jgi:hypothetical protein